MIESTQSGRPAQADTRQADMPETTITAGSSILLGLAAALLALGLFAYLAFSLGRGVFLRLDQDALGGAYVVRSTESWLTPLMASATAIGTMYGVAIQAAAVAALLWWRKPHGWRSSLALLAITLIGASLLFVALKYQFERPRPQIYPSPYSHSTYSFPSGHATTAAAFYGGLAVIAARSTRRRRRIAIAAVAAVTVVLIGTSRLYFSVHYPTDVLGGFCAGLAWLIAIQTSWHGITWRRGRRHRPAQRSAPADHRAAGVDRQP